uniref:NR LBD domain-containing protein n=2 Tax=Caenorhabditis tropicalis TaxID=1561998 RepID=A0A1I7TY62_9PELO
MKLNLSAMLEVKNQKDDAVATLIESLLYQDARREKALITNFTFENPTLEEVIESKQLTIVVRDPSHEMTSSDWCFFGAYTAVKFLLGLGFMKRLGTKDKTLLLANYSAKATLLFSAIRTMRAKNDKMIKPDGKDFFIEFLSQWSDFSLHFTNRVRSMLVNRLIELNITNEEFILITVLFFCNPALTDLSENAVIVLTQQQRVYSDALMQYCLLTYQQNGPSRFTDLLSLCTVTNKYFEDVQYLYWIFQYHFHVKYKNLVASVI